MTPRLVAENASTALEFYVEVFGAEVLERYTDPSRGDRLIHSTVRIGETTFSLVDAVPEWGNHAPTQLGGTCVLLTLEVDDADAVADKMIAAGAKVIIPVDDRFYGKREGRLRDPFGHLWIVSQLLETLSDDEISRRIAEFSAGD